MCFTPGFSLSGRAVFPNWTNLPSNSNEHFYYLRFTISWKSSRGRLRSLMGLSSASWPLDLAVWVGLLDGGGGGGRGARCAPPHPGVRKFVPVHCYWNLTESWVDKHPIRRYSSTSIKRPPSGKKDSGRLKGVGRGKTIENPSSGLSLITGRLIGVRL